MPEVGDVIFEENGSIQHPYIICSYLGQARPVNMADDGPLIIGALPQSGNLVTFRCANRDLSRLASQYAAAWSYPMVDEDCYDLPDDDDLATNDARLTPYAGSGPPTARYYGWQSHRYSGETAPFEHDALYRAFKWAGRLKKTPSSKKGMTCDVFICACFHAAAINLLYKGDLDKIEAKAKILGAGRSDQKASRTDRHQHNRSPSGSTYENSVLRAWSNVGALTGQSPDFLCHWKSTLSDGAGLPESLDEIFTAALLVDAKFTHGAQLKARMESDQQGWQQA